MLSVIVDPGATSAGHLNLTTTYAYDDADHLISVTDPASNVTQYNYDTENNLVSITDANNHTTHFAYDTMGRVVGRIAVHSLKKRSP